MKIISSYLNKSVMSAVLVVLIVFIGLEFFLLVLGEFPNFGRGQYGLFQAFVYSVLMLPSYLYQAFPLVLLLGCLMGLGKLASKSELVVMLASGISRLQIIRAILKGTLVLLICAIFVGEFLGPMGQVYAYKYKAKQTGSEASQNNSGFWLRSGNDFVHIATEVSANEIKGVTRFQFDNNQRLLSASFAEGGHKKNNNLWILKNIKTTYFTQSGSTQTGFLAEESWPLHLNLKILKNTRNDTEQESLVRLHQYIVYRDSTGLNSDQYQFAFWQRIFFPLASLLMVILALPFIFGSLRSVAIGVRTLVAIAVTFIFYLLNIIFGPLSMLFQIPPLLAASFPSLLLVSIGSIYLFFRYKKVSD